MTWTLFEGKRLDRSYPPAAFSSSCWPPPGRRSALRLLPGRRSALRLLRMSSSFLCAASLEPETPTD
eukprot:7273272-Alexandrium_andersonii.AAC.1